MKKENLQTLGVIAIIALVIFLIFSFLVRKSDTAFCHDVFKGLTQGRLSAVEKYIDWGALKAMGVDVGDTYKKLPNAKEKENYRKAFVANLSKSFKNAGGSPRDFTNWRVYERGSLKTIVVADYNKKGKKMLLTIYGYEKRKITAIEMEDKGE